MDHACIDMEYSPYYVTLDKGNHTAYVLSGMLDPEGDVRLVGSSITPITYSETQGFTAGPTVGLNGTVNAIAADPNGHRVYAGTYFGRGIEEKYFGVQIYDPADGFKQCGFIPLPIADTYDYEGLVTRQVAIHENRLFVGVDNQDPEPGASGVVYIIEDFSGTPRITTIEDIETTGPGMRNFSFFENRLYFVNYDSRNLICVDIDRKKLGSVTDVSDGEPLGSGRGFPIATVISPSKKEIYVAQHNAGARPSIKTLDIATEVPSPIGHIRLQARGLFTMNIDDAGGFICGGSSYNDNFLTFVDTAADKEAPNMPMEGAVYSLALDGDRRRAYIANATQKKVFCYAGKLFTP